MRSSLLTTFVLAILLATTAWSQTGTVPRHPVDPNAEYLGTIQLDLTTQSEPEPKAEKSRSLFGTEITGIAGSILIFRSGDRTDYQVVLESIKFLGAAPIIDNMATPMLFNLICRTAVLQGVAAGYTSCPAGCSGNTPVTRVYLESCVQRFGSGPDTRFTACNPAVGMREYVVCCPLLGLPIPSVDMIRYEGAACNHDNLSSCEFTGP